MILATFDTNVLVSSLLTHRDDSATVTVVRMMLEGKIVPLYNDEILCEYSEVLRRSKFHFPEARVQFLLDSIVAFGMNTNRLETGLLFPDMDDLVFYEVTMSKTEDDAYLITGNIRHFQKQSNIVTPAEMLEIVNARFK
ncbi:MAG: PIN domain-containing protein [Candidatus Saccharibacteria bacterium]|nr:PIN domain-containing protein [Candidatus Saccharibacteria bacterium]